ncbi:MAG: Hemoprotein HemQ, essential component of heme biosynthetic pathway in Gram-positive bacteria [uncultured Acidimicrobiales bacterium]|uniref:Coproheme decarboxylase n=1 Tax=uncultured Acidimicrobiales bacterium TaxID=310071 RepID=A0A6J4IR40_9ACTN|nr:MAG: Hemoprotein HemQ, essential component of heme biosynthetic pathway in Gram-positive bacteria [uncultured Acidimicrobiales bacterium]
MPEPLSPSTGWGALHLFCKLTPSTDAEAILTAVKSAQADGHQVVTFAVLGHKADLGFLALGPDLWRLRAFQAAIQAAGLELADSYVSLTEVSEYAKGMPEERLRPRLYPELPPEGKNAICFYPMSKRRGGPDQNWFTLPYEDRERLMYEHGSSGRKFSGRIVQLITGSAGIDDYEWGVTLFGVRPDDLKDVVYTMRFDEASAVYADFGPFFTGLIAEPAEVLAQLGVS